MYNGMMNSFAYSPLKEFVLNGKKPSHITVYASAKTLFLIRSTIYLISTMMTPEINFVPIRVGVWPMIDLVNLDLNSKIPTRVYRNNDVEWVIRTNMNNNNNMEIITRIERIMRAEGSIIDRRMSSEKIKMKPKEV
ncbi:myb-like protein X [Vespula squamosa]|uniref:Myb-like protein X n=1 Tax=Vespula squamosa TaxID=30214 RepID=A0ABD2C956_VESSQ